MTPRLRRWSADQCRTLRQPDGAYAVLTPAFEGPFDLLLHLILKQEVDLWEINLATIVDEYLTSVEQLERVDLDVATEFLLIAATLVELKARASSHLPRRSTSMRNWLVEERDLLARLLECKTFQDAALVVMSQRLQTASRWVPRTAGPGELLPARPTRSNVPVPTRSLPRRRPVSISSEEFIRTHIGVDRRACASIIRPALPSVCVCSSVSLRTGVSE